MDSSIVDLAEQFSDHHPFLQIPEEAYGRCLWAVLAFAAFAKGHGVEVKLVRWFLFEDTFIDHWVIYLDDETVIDFTRAQIDEGQGLIFKKTGYPTNYHFPQTYPSSIFLDEEAIDMLLEIEDDSDEQFDISFQKAITRARLDYDRKHRSTPTLSPFQWMAFAAAIALLIHQLSSM